MKLSDYFVGRLKAGQHDTAHLVASAFARVEFDGSIWFYDVPEDTDLEEFKVAAEVAFEMDADHAEIWGSNGYAVVRFY